MITEYAAVPAGFSVVSETQNFVTVRCPLGGEIVGVNNTRPILEWLETLLAAGLRPLCLTPMVPNVICAKA